MPDQINPYTRLTATQAAAYAGVTVQAIINWRNRGHLRPAGVDDRGRPLYLLLDVAKAELATRRKARRLRHRHRQVVELASFSAADELIPVPGFENQHR